MTLIWLSSHLQYLIVDADVLAADRSVFGPLQPGSYADELVDRLCAYFFEGLLNLRKEHEQFYSDDYGDFREFLYWKYDVPEDVLDDLADDLSRGVQVGYGKTTTGSDGSLLNLFDSDEGTGLLRLMFSFQESTTDETAD